MRRYLNFHGVYICVESTDARVMRDLAHDFHYFIVDKTPRDARVFRLRHLRRGRPPERWRRLARVGRSTLYWPGRGWQRVGFFGSAWVSYSFSRRRAVVRAMEPAIAYEVLYLVLLSYCGERLDALGMHRVHGLGIAGRRGAMLVMAPSGGGKSSIAMEWLETDDARLLSDDVPLVAGDRMFAFPQRIAMRARPDVPARYLRKFRRARYGEKWVVGAEFFDGRVSDEAALGWIAIMRKTDGPVSRLTEVSSRHLVVPLLKWLVLGLETPQVWELFLRPSPRDVGRKALLLASRARTAWRLARGCRALRFDISTRPAESAAVLHTFLSELD